MGLLAAGASAQWRHFGDSSSPAHYDLAREMLAAHNEARARFQLPPLRWSKDIAAYAQQWANYLEAHHEFRHRKQSKYGENLFTISGDTAAPSAVVKDWVSEAKNYDYRSNSCQGVCGHYTQIVWRDTREVGCAVAPGRNGETWVCNYSPPGNIIGERPY